MEFLVVVVMLVVVVAIGFVSVQKRKAQIQAWRSFAHEHKLQLLQAGTFGNPKIRGQYRGMDVRLQIEIRGSGKHRKTYTRAIARFPMAMPRGLNITREGFTDALAKLVGGQDIEIGNEELDSRLRIKGKDVPAVLALMAKWRARNAIATFLARNTDAAVTQQHCTEQKRGFVGDVVSLRAMLEAVCRTVDEVRQALEEPDGAPVTELPASSVAPVSAPEPELGPLPLTTPRVVPLSTSPPAPFTDAAGAARFDWEPSQPEPIAPPMSSTDLFAELRGVAPPAAPLEEAMPPASWAAQAGPAPPADPPQASAGAPETLVVTGSAIPVEQLVALDERGSSVGDTRAHVSKLQGRPVALELVVERVSLTMGMGVPSALENGHTVIGTPVDQPGPRLAVRFPPSRSEELRDLGYGDRLVLRGVFVSWDDFYRQVLIDAM